MASRNQKRLGILLRSARRNITGSSTRSKDNGTRNELSHDVHQESRVLANEIREAYQERETDGIVELARRQWERLLGDYLEGRKEVNNKETASLIIQASLQAACAKGQTASIFNGWVASCCERWCLNESESFTTPNDRDQATAICESLQVSMAKLILETMEQASSSGETSTIAGVPRPDIMTYSLAYTTLHVHQHEREAEKVLKRALHQSKKQAGSKRRKAFAAKRRRQGSTDTFYDDDRVTELGLSMLQSWLNQDGDVFQILAETDEWIAVHKPAGVVCNHMKQTTRANAIGKSLNKRKGKMRQNGNKQPNMSVVDALFAIGVPLSTLNPQALGLVHRLDRGTSGCMVLAKTDHSHCLAVTEFYMRRTHKKYVTLLEPEQPLPSSSRSSTLTSSPSLLHSSHSEGQVDLPVDGRPSRSNYKVLQKLRLPRHGDLESYDEMHVAGQTVAVLVEIETLTGRKHQVRVHAAEGLNAPVVLDSVYGKTNGDSSRVLEKTLHPTKERGKQPLDRFFLHASSLHIPALQVNVNSTLPEWWVSSLELLEEVLDNDEETTE